MANLVLLGTLLLPVLVTGALDGAAGGKGKGEAHRLLQAAGDEEGSWGEGMEVVNQHAVAPSKMSGVSAAIPDLASLAKGGIIGGQCKTEDCNDFDLLIHDEDRDGRCVATGNCPTQNCLLTSPFGLLPQRHSRRVCGSIAARSGGGDE